jgi:hypothetical protein
LPVGQGTFDWPPMWMSQANGGVLNDFMMQSYLSSFEQKALALPAWPAFISTAFPRFLDIYQQAGWVLLMAISTTKTAIPFVKP